MARRKSYPGHLERHGDQWRLTFSIRGKRHRLCLDGDLDQEEIEAAAREEYNRLAKRDPFDGDNAKRTVRFSELLAEYKAGVLPTLAPGTQRSYNDTFKPVKDYFVNEGEDRRVDRIRPGNVRRYLTWRRRNRRDGKDPLSNRTLAKDRSVLHALFEYALDAEYCENNPVARVKAPKWDDREYVILRRDDDGVSKQYERLLEECQKSGPMLHLYTLLLGETGVRCESEALHLRWEDIDLSGDPPAIWVTGRRDAHRSKSGKGRWVPVSERLEKALKEYMATYRFNAARSPYVFHHEFARRHAKAGERVRSFRRAFDSAAVRAKLPEGFVRHDLRHTRCTWWLEDGIDIVTVQMAMGHSDVKVTMRYTHLTRRNLRKMRPAEDPARQRLSAMR